MKLTSLLQGSIAGDNLRVILQLILKIQSLNSRTEHFEHKKRMDIEIATKSGGNEI